MEERLWRHILNDAVRADGVPFKGAARMEDNHVVYGERKFANIRDKEFFYIQMLKVRNDKLIIDGRHRFDFLEDGYELYALVDGAKEVRIEPYRFTKWDLYDEEHEELLIRGYGFHLEIDIKGVRSISFRLRYDGNSVTLRPFYGKFAKFRTGRTGSHYWYGKYILKPTASGMTIHPYRARSIIKQEFIYLTKTVIPDKHYKEAFYRVCALVYRLFKKRPVWLIGERGYASGDNGEALYLHMLRNTDPREIDFRYVMYRINPMWKELRKTGRVLEYGSFRHTVLQLCADRIISTQSNRMNSYKDMSRYAAVKDLLDGDFVFLSHGINEKDISDQFHKQSKNCAAYFVASDLEYKVFMESEYAFLPEEVAVVGFPRYDRLVSEPEKKILFLPTWRRSLAGGVDAQSGKFTYGDTLKDSDYFKLYNSLINDERLLTAMKQYGYTGDFYMHPTIVDNWIDFDSNDTIQVHSEIAIYREIFKTASLMITDYSSVAFDFAYLNKPIVYSQCDGGAYFEMNGFKRSAFSYTDDGFGPVCTTREAVIDAIIRYMEDDCKVEPEYEANRNRFFKYNDRNNSARAVQYIRTMNDRY